MSKDFIPTQEQRLKATELLECGASIDTARRMIINDETTLPISKATFCLAFRQEIDEAEIDGIKEAVLTLKEKVREGDIKAITYYINCRGRRFFKEKFKLESSLSIADQIDQVLQAGADGLIGADEVAAYCSGIKFKADAKMDQLLAVCRELLPEDKIKAIFGEDKPNAG